MTSIPKMATALDIVGMLLSIAGLFYIMLSVIYARGVFKTPRERIAFYLVQMVCFLYDASGAYAWFTHEWSESTYWGVRVPVLMTGIGLVYWQLNVIRPFVTHPYWAGTRYTVLQWISIIIYLVLGGAPFLFPPYATEWSSYAGTLSTVWFATVALSALGLLLSSARRGLDTRHVEPEALAKFEKKKSQILRIVAAQCFLLLSSIALQVTSLFYTFPERRYISTLTTSVICFWPSTLPYLVNYSRSLLKIRQNMTKTASEKQESQDWKVYV
ncbi:hypothetical protein EDD86DRAFT_70899 [Gorgonomyces haynaldii]|nr:hypothetical protein EDD86DRAFT_70899 [Gorgonomyces haynaldii]